jgi:5-(carboxyamino)imidazole ribonucleotide mutase
MAIGNAKNAGLMAARILGIKYPAIAAKLQQYAEAVADEVRSLKI